MSTISDETLRKLIRDVPDFPQPGIVFKDITPLLADKVIFKGVVEQVCSHWTERPPDVVTAIEARGFIPGGAAAAKLIRKLGGIVLGVHVLIELSFLGGRGRLQGIEVVSELVY